MDALNRLRARNTEIESRMKQIDAEANGERFTDAQTTEWNDLGAELDENRKHIDELEARQQVLEKLSQRDQNTEPERDVYRASYANKKSRVPDDPTAIHEYRNTTRSFDEYSDALKEGALRLVERMSTPVQGADLEGTQGNLETLLKYKDDPRERALAHRIIVTSSPEYERAFMKYVQGGRDALNDTESRALSLTSGSGGYAVPVVLDPTVIRVSSHVINPFRAICSVETITGNTWQGVSSTGITAAYGAEATEASDNAPALVQPSGNVEKAFAFVPFSIEIGEDWAGMGAEMSRMIAEEKDRLEASSFLTGLGHASSQPQGLIAVGGATAVVTSASTATFAVGDVYSLQQGLSPRFRARASWLANLAAINKIRQFDTYGGSSFWTDLNNDAPARLLGQPIYELSTLSSAITTSASTIVTYGDFSYFKIIDRVGMNVEYIPHLFSTANNRPTGQRGLYVYWRNTSVVTTPGLQANSAFVSLKLL